MTNILFLYKQVEKMHVLCQSTKESGIFIHFVFLGDTVESELYVCNIGKATYASYNSFLDWHNLIDFKHANLFYKN